MKREHTTAVEANECCDHDHPLPAKKVIYLCLELETAYI
jgi:hypothetical protein